ncbi:hypothetical protein NPIL_345241 [Nephila pilipes]|uniref:Uncharacterized protein n=1 Tax=Nephila pilipes TaxID=299642 RepID=A0A8X6TFK2_NEPPI|nr:hypothetical protein NPIL_345241 [Nephila pilipes]
MKSEDFSPNEGLFFKKCHYDLSLTLLSVEQKLANQQSNSRHHRGHVRKLFFLVRKLFTVGTEDDRCAPRVVGTDINQGTRF